MAKRISVSSVLRGGSLEIRRLNMALLGAGEPWARISLTVQSDLAAVGLTAAFARALAAEGISCNVIAGVHHDHLLVPWDRRDDAMATLRRLSDA